MDVIMTATSQPRQVKEKMQAYRNRLRSAGLRPVQYWVPDLRQMAVRAQITKSLLDTPGDIEILHEMESMQDWPVE